MTVEYRIVEEWAAPDYVDIKTHKNLYDSCDCSVQCLWVVSYDTEEHEIIEWLERFELSEEDKANDYIANLKDGTVGTPKEEVLDLLDRMADDIKESVATGEGHPRYWVDTIEIVKSFIK